jgi:predicted site-specific integrase-resolvase
MGISHATLLNWKKRGLIKPAAETPTGRDLWDEEEITKINKRSER